uniref:hypothetical protein n=1 Tax=Ndongobacter massiliensis TaxID=1871025 RepID=UPI0009304DD9|nr:hypothetical protein [Ndongobacter massiliensis]
MKKNKLSLIALILGVLAVVIEVGAAGGVMSSAKTGAESLGATIGLAIVMPSLCAMVIAVILNAIGYFMIHRTITLISAILYAVALILMPLWGFVGIPSMILQFVAFAKMKKEPVPEQ